jgi:hypothetical protein
MLPSIATLKQIAPERARELRRILEITTRAEIENLTPGRHHQFATWSANEKATREVASSKSQEITLSLL